MTERLERTVGHLEVSRRCQKVIADALRERRATRSRDTVVTALRSWWIPLIWAVLVACGGGTRSDTYARATDVQAECCENLQGPERDRCLSEIVRIEDPAAAKTPTSQSTYACVAEHFVCDRASGRPTQPSAQAQYDCIEDQAQ